ncbi:MAG: 4a-hydroxytetrahydrobiopterin dehydratase, partial [Sphingobacteriia bacterium]
MRMAPVPYTETEIHHRLEEVPGWQYRAGSLCRTFAFADFAQAFAFMAAVAAEAEKANHHPMWKNRYGRVEIWLRTHEVDGITAKDFDLAAACSRHGHIAQIEPTGPYPMRVKVRNTAGHSLPAYESMHAAGMDVRACLAQPLSLAPGAFQAIGTGLYLEIPEGYEIQLRPRSGLAAKHGITLLN